MGYKPWDYYRLTFSEYHAAISGYFRKCVKEYEHTRAICWMIAAVNRDPKKKMPPMEKWWPLPTDDKYAPAAKVEELKAKLSRIDAMMKKRLNRLPNG